MKALCASKALFLFRKQAPMPFRESIAVLSLGYVKDSPYLRAALPISKAVSASQHPLTVRPKCVECESEHNVMRDVLAFAISHSN